MVQVRDDDSLDKEGDEKTKRGRQISKTGGNTANVTHLNFRKKNIIHLGPEGKQKTYISKAQNS